MAIVGMMRMALVQVIRVVFVLNLGVATLWAMLVGV